MAKRQSKFRKFTKPGLPILILVLVLIGAGVYALSTDHKTPAASKTSSTRSQYPAPSPADNTPNNTRKTSSNPAQTLDNGPTTNSSSTISNAFSVQIDPVVSASNIHVGDMVSGATTGNCTLTASQNGQTVQLATSTVQQDVNYYDCGVYNVSVSKFPDNGNWNLVLTVVSNGTTEEGSANINVK